MGCEPVQSTNNHKEQAGDNKRNEGNSNNRKDNKVNSSNKGRDCLEQVVSLSNNVNNIENESIKDKQITIIINLGFDKLWKRKYHQNTVLSIIINEFIKETSNKDNDFRKLNAINWFANSTPVNLSLPLQSILPKCKELSQAHELKLAFCVLGLPDIPNNSNTHIRNELYLIGKPLWNPFAVLIYNKRQKGFSLAQFDSNTITKHQLNAISALDAYCNGNNCLFISGGERGISQGHLCVICLIKHHEQHIESYMHFSLSEMMSHSMIYIPLNYVFFIGGETDASMYFEINKREFIQWSKLKQKQIEPALAFVNSQYLYSFSNSNTIKHHKGLGEGIVTIQRTNLRSEPQWETIIPKCRSGLRGNSNRFTPRFFGVCEEDKDKLIFIGGIQLEDDDAYPSNSDHDVDHQYGIGSKHCFSYSHKDNELFESTTIFKEIEISEKGFLPFNSKYYFAIPKIEQRKAKVCIYNNNKKRVDLITYEPMTDSNWRCHHQSQASSLSEFHASLSLIPKKYIVNIPSIDDITHSSIVGPSSKPKETLHRLINMNQISALHEDEITNKETYRHQKERGGGEAEGIDDIVVIKETPREYNQEEDSSIISNAIPVIIRESQITSKLVSIDQSQSNIGSSLADKSIIGHIHYEFGNKYISHQYNPNNSKCISNANNNEPETHSSLMTQSKPSEITNNTSSKNKQSSNHISSLPLFKKNHRHHHHLLHRHSHNNKSKKHH